MAPSDCSLEKQHEQEGRGSRGRRIQKLKSFRKAQEHGARFAWLEDVDVHYSSPSIEFRRKIATAVFPFINVGSMGSFFARALL